MISLVGMDSDGIPSSGRFKGKNEFLGEYDQCRDDVKGRIYNDDNTSELIQAVYSLLTFFGTRQDSGTINTFSIAHCTTPKCAIMFRQLSSELSKSIIFILVIFIFHQ